MIRKKQITIIKNEDQNWYKNQILGDGIEKRKFKTKYIVIKSLRTKLI
jgi:hypothetical protein